MCLKLPFCDCIVIIRSHFIYHNNIPKILNNKDSKVVLPGRFELPFAASETAALSIELREQIKVG